MRARLTICLALPGFALWLITGLQAQPREPERPDDLMAALAAVRSGGCAGEARVASTLRPVQRLAETAQRIARGDEPGDAAKKAGYRSTRLVVLKMSGYGSPARVGEEIARKHCKALADPDLTDFGWHRERDSYWVLVAAPFAPPPPGAAEAVAQRILTLSNEARSKPRQCGTAFFEAAPPVRPNALLARAASAHAWDMARHGYLEHQGRDGSSAADRAARAGYRWRSVGENIASGQTTPERVVREWLRSPGHCETLMNPGFTEMGVAYAVDLGSAEGIYWAQLLGRPR